MLASAIPTKFQVPFANAPDAGTSRVVPYTTATPGAASLQKGFTSVNMTPVATGGIPPFGQDFNGLLNQVTAWIQWNSAGGPITYDATFSSEIGGYPQGAVIMSATVLGRLWLSTVDSNTTNPDAAGAGWRVFNDVTSVNVYAGNPNTHVAGTVGVAPSTPPSICWDVTNNLLWVCTTTGNAAAAVWTQIGGGAAAGPNWGGTSTGSANAQVITAPSSLQAFVTGTEVSFKAGFTNTGAATLAVGAFGAFPLRRRGITGPVALTGGEVFAGVTYDGFYDGTYIQITPALGTAATANASSATGVVAAVNGAVAAGHLALFGDTAGTIIDGGLPNAAAAPVVLRAGATIGGGLWALDTEAGAFTVVLVATPAPDTIWGFQDPKGTWGGAPPIINTNGLTVTPPGATIAQAGPITCDTPGLAFELWYDGTTLRFI